MFQGILSKDQLVGTKLYLIAVEYLLELQSPHYQMRFMLIKSLLLSVTSKGNIEHVFQCAAYFVIFFS